MGDRAPEPPRPPAPAAARQPADDPQVSVVIPTRGRPHMVVRALRSALDQTCPPAEVIVVVDGPDPETETALSSVEDARLRTVTSSTSHGAAHARNAGIAAATSAWIALLDDDDEWLPGKLAAQLAAVGEAGREPGKGRPVVSCGVEWRRGDITHHWPLRAPRPDETVAEYLFLRKRAGEGMLATPTILLPRDLAAATPFRSDLPAHEDFDWFLSLEQAGGQFLVVLETLVIVNAPPVRQSLSRAGRWEESLAWARSRRADLGPRVFGAFCLTEVARTARRQAGMHAFVTLLLAGLSGRPSLFEVARYFAIWILPPGAGWRWFWTS